MRNATAEPEEKKSSGLKPAQVSAAALAAVTAAFLAGRLGLYGTVLGAGIMSLVTTIGSEVYLRSLRRTKEAAARRAKLVTAVLIDPDARQTKVETLALDDQDAGRATGAGASAAAAGAGEAGAADGSAGAVAGGADGSAGAAAGGADGSAGGAAGADGSDGAGAQGGLGDAAGSVEGATEGPLEERGPWYRRLRWPLIVGTSVLAFVIGMVVLTGFELATGTSVSGGQGSTVGQIVRGGAEQHEERQRENRQDDAPKDGTVEPTPTRQPGAPGQDTESPTATTTAPTTGGTSRTKSTAPTTQPPGGAEHPPGTPAPQP
ncbi:hypothetical protein [Amycolatopsis arida]|uniref:hypothetical protein n=1 Tax=Amycolatopsis arida TaxID=587909 RepID=UPI000B82A86A|nr:hypothetical protein [Amycolatopsis arida]